MLKLTSEFTRTLPITATKIRTFEIISGVLQNWGSLNRNRRVPVPFTYTFIIHHMDQK